MFFCRYILKVRPHNIKWLIAEPFVVFVDVDRFAVLSAELSVASHVLLVVLSVVYSKMAAANPAPQMGRVIGSTATYSDGLRMRKPMSTLANEYIAFKTSFQRQGGADEKTLTIDGSTVDTIELGFYEPSFTAAEFLNEPFHQACIACYQEFRIRCVKVTLHSLLDPVLTGLAAAPHKCKSWIWYPDNHIGINPATEIGNYTDMLESGEKIVPCGYRMSDNLTMRAVPQTLYGVSMNEAGAQLFKDIPHPWETTSAFNLSKTMRMPFFVWRKNFGVAPTAQYAVTFSAIVEFRNPRDNQL